MKTSLPMMFVEHFRRKNICGKTILRMTNSLFFFLFLHTNIFNDHFRNELNKKKTSGKTFSDSNKPMNIPRLEY